MGLSHHDFHSVIRLQPFKIIDEILRKSANWKQ